MSSTSFKNQPQSHQVMQQTKWYSWCTGQLSRGCRLCVQGRKLVLFITGLCGQRCFYCPISDQKFGCDVVYANEWKVANPDNPVELLEEARLTEAHGAGITGGDPLAVTDRCCTYIRLLKQHFGKQFHVHLYTPLQLVNMERLQKLSDAGLDEIRFHPDLNDHKLWHNLDLAKMFKWNVGVEIPAIPEYESKTKTLIDFIAGKVDFLNLNELELSDTQSSHYRLAELGYTPKDDLSYGTAGSQKMALDMLSYAESKGLDAHFCTAKLKDAVQVRKRMQLRARNVALPFDICTKEGLLLRGCAYLPEIVPGAGYKKQLDAADRKEMSKRLHNAHKAVSSALNGSNNVVIDESKLRLLMPRAIVKQATKKLKKLGLIPALVEEYPTADSLEIDVEFL